MKKRILFITIIFLFTGISFAQRVEMKTGDKIEVIEFVNKKGQNTGFMDFSQNGEKLKYMKMFKTLEGMEVCAENMKIARKHRNGAITMTVIGVITIPLGYLILIGPIMSKRKKEFKYVKLAVEDYNKSLE